jgi:hypothetical protein
LSLRIYQHQAIAALTVHAARQSVPLLLLLLMLLLTLMGMPA